MATRTDDFARGDSGDLGANWTQIGSTAGTCGILSEQVDSTVTGNPEGSVWSADTFGDPQFSKVAVVTLAAHEMGAVVRGSTTGNDYYAGGHNRNNHGNDNRRIYKYVAGSYSNLATEAVDIAVSDDVRLEADGTSLDLLIGGVSKVTTTDSSHSSGKPGLAVFHSSTNVAIWDDWEGGDLAAGGLSIPVAMHAYRLSHQSVV